jgi:hypothetical protein
MKWSKFTDPARVGPVVGSEPHVHIDVVLHFVRLSGILTIKESNLVFRLGVVVVPCRK